MSIKTKSVLIRFAKGAISGAVSAMGAISLVSATTWVNLSMTLNALALAGSIGALSGLLLALQKWATWTE